MRKNRTVPALLALSLLVSGSLLSWWSWTAASTAVTVEFAKHSAALVKAGLAPLTVLDVLRPHHTSTGELFPRLLASTPPCGSDCIAQRVVKDYAVRSTRFGRIEPVPLVAGMGITLLLLGILCVAFARRPNPRRNLINYQRNRIRLRTHGNVLPIVQVGKTRWGLTRRDNLRKGGRREFGNAIFMGKPGAGKSSLLKLWLMTADSLNFVVVDLKGDLWDTTAAHRAGLGKVIRFDLTSLEGHSLDPLDTDDQGTAQAVIDAFLPRGTGNKSDYFAAQAAEIALAYWRAARLTLQSPMLVLVKAATGSTSELLDLAQGLIALAPQQRRAELVRRFQAAYGSVWDDVEAAAGGERGSVIQSFKGAFAALDTPSILSTLCKTTFDPADLVEEHTTVYITAPSTSAPYKVPLEVLVGTIVEIIKRYVDHDRRGVQGKDIVILADEAGVLHIPDFVDTLSSGRSRGITVAAFCRVWVNWTSIIRAAGAALWIPSTTGPGGLPMTLTPIDSFVSAVGSLIRRIPAVTRKRGSVDRSSKRPLTTSMVPAGRRRKSSACWITTGPIRFSDQRPLFTGTKI